VTATDSVAAPRSKAEREMFRAITRTVLLVHAAASSSMKRVEEASAASAKSPLPAAGDGHVEEAGGARQQRG
jgi:hypothetical protein